LALLSAPGGTFNEVVRLNDSPIESTFTDSTDNLPVELEDNETVQRVVTFDWTTYLPAILFLFGAFVVPAALVNQGYDRLTAVSFAALVVAVPVGIALLRKAQRGNQLIITDQRLIFTRGLFGRSTREVSIDQITSVRAWRDFLQRFTGCGTVEVNVAGDADGPQLFPNVRDPQRVVAQVIENIDAFKRNRAEQAERHDAPFMVTAASHDPNAVDEIERLYALFREGAINADEYATAKHRLLSQL
jgi:uncharacterized membrane protein YdbT with pleckstrin-like domain